MEGDELEDKVEEKVEEKREFPFEPRAEDAGSRVVGWRDGGGITRVNQRKILGSKEEKLARQEYRDARKAIEQSKAREQEEPLKGLPPTWQAFWSTVPGLDAQAAYKQYEKEHRRVLREQEPAPAAAADGVAALEAVEAETQRLEEEVRRRKQELADKQRIVADWNAKLARLRAEEKAEEESSRKFLRTLDSASFKHGILEGKIRSSDQYFHFLYEDTQTMHSKKVANLKRSCALMNGAIDEMQAEVRKLRKVRADASMIPDGSSVAPDSAAASAAEEEEEASGPADTAEKLAT